MSPADPLAVEPHLPALRRYARALTQDALAADDLVQQTLVRALEKAASFRAQAALRPWLLAILHNCFMSNMRRARVERDALATLAHRIAPATPPDQDDVVEVAALRRRFALLSDMHRAVLHLIVVEGLSYRDAADALEVPVGTVMSRLARARAALRDIETPATGLRIVGGRDAG